MKNDEIVHSQFCLSCDILTQIEMKYLNIFEREQLEIYIELKFVLFD